jgi:hypothetical protein
MPASVEREEVVRIVAGRLGLSEQLVASLGAGAAPAGVRSSVSARPNGDGNGGGARSALDTRGRSEAAFLALCIALPEQGAGALASVDPETHFTVPVLQRAAAHLREHLDDPGGGVTDDDPQLTSALAELVMRSDRDPADRATLEVQRLQLELARLDRVLATARSEQSGDVTPLAREREAARLALDAAMEDL